MILTEISGLDTIVRQKSGSGLAPHESDMGIQHERMWVYYDGGGGEGEDGNVCAVPTQLSRFKQHCQSATSAESTAVFDPPKR